MPFHSIARVPPVASAVGGWLAELLTILHITSPPGVKYTGHSVRGGAASAALSSMRWMAKATATASR